MYIQQSAPATFRLSFRLQTIFATLAHAVKMIVTDNIPAQPDGLGSGLQAHLQYDVGEIDYDPRRLRSRENPSPCDPQLCLYHHVQSRM